MYCFIDSKLLSYLKQPMHSCFKAVSLSRQNNSDSNCLPMISASHTFGVIKMNVDKSYLISRLHQYRNIGTPSLDVYHVPLSVTTASFWSGMDQPPHEVSPNSKTWHCQLGYNSSARDTTYTRCYLGHSIVMLNRSLLSEYMKHTHLTREAKLYAGLGCDKKLKYISDYYWESTLKRGNITLPIFGANANSVMIRMITCNVLWSKRWLR